MTNEKIIYQTKLNWILYFKSLMVMLIGFLLFGLSVYSRNNSFLFGMAELFLIFGIISSGITYIEIKTFEFAVTNKRVLIKQGILRTQSQEIMLNKVEGIYVEQGIIDRLVNSGSIIIKGTGGSQNPLRHIDNPFQFRIAVNEQIENLGFVR